MVGVYKKKKINNVLRFFDMTSYTGLRLEPVAALGVNLLPSGSVHWNASRQFFYPVGSQIQQYHIETNQMQFLFPERFNSHQADVVKICDVVSSNSGQFIAISEVSNHGILSIYDTETQVVHVQIHSTSRQYGDIQQFSSLSFSSDSNYITALGEGKTDSKIFKKVFVWKMGRQVSLAAIVKVNDNVTQVGLDPQNESRLLLFGPDSISTVFINTIDKEENRIECDFKNLFQVFQDFY